MVTRHRPALLTTAVALTAVLAGCGGGTGSTPAAAPVTPAGPLPGPALRAEAFGTMCPQIPSHAKAGGFDALSTKPISEAALDSSFTQRFAFALDAAHLRDSVNRMPAITVFAPYDAAFDRFEHDLGSQRFQSLVGDPDALAQVLRNHIVDTRYDRAGLVAAGTVHPLGGEELRIADTGQTLTITDGSGASAHVLCGNIQTANANLYLIDRVLSPTSPAPAAG